MTYGHEASCAAPVQEQYALLVVAPALLFELKGSPAVVAAVERRAASKNKFTVTSSDGRLAESLCNDCLKSDHFRGHCAHLEGSPSQVSWKHKTTRKAAFQ